MAKYFDKQKLDIVIAAAKDIVAKRNQVLQQTGIDILDTDAISSALIYETVTQYDADYNVNFARNGEDAKSNGVLIEQKATRVAGPLTKTGKQRKGAGTDAAFQFHAMGDLDHPRYIFVARHKETLQLLRIYDISSQANTQKVLTHLEAEKAAWLARGFQKRDIILITEKFILDNLTFSYKQTIGNCVILRD
jgi:hypothetical protein